MKTHPLSKKQWYYVALASLVAGVIFAGPFIGLIAIAALTAFLFYGIYDRLTTHLKPAFAALLTFVASFIVIVPAVLIVIFTVIQLTHLATDLTTFIDPETSAGIVSIVGWLNSLLSPLVGTEIVSVDGALDFVRTVVPEALRSIAGFVTEFVGGVPVAIALTIMYIILFYEFLIYGKKITKNVVALSPFEPKVTTVYIERVGQMAKAMARGQLYISFIISVLSALILGLFLNMWDYFFLMTIAFTLLNLVPLGCGIVVIPITIVAMLSGAFVPGLIALILYIGISNLDAVIRPRIIPKNIVLTPGLTMVAAFGGIAMFGLIGVVYGPILMIIIVTSVQMYLEYYSETVKKPSNSQK